MSVRPFRRLESRRIIEVPLRRTISLIRCIMIDRDRGEVEVGVGREEGMVGMRDGLIGGDRGALNGGTVIGGLGLMSLRVVIGLGGEPGVGVLRGGISLMK